MRVRGIVRGKKIVIDNVVGLPEGQGVEVEIRTTNGDAPDKYLAVFERMEDCMEVEQYRKWALIHNEEYVGTYDTRREAQESAARLFKGEPCLIRQFGTHSRVFYRPTTYTPVPRKYFEQNEVTLINADD